MEYKKISELTELPGNPRTIKDDSFKKLCDSIKNNKEYFEARPIIASDRTGELIILAGNQRFKAAKFLKLKEVPVFVLSGLTIEKEKEITIRDNVSNGDWDWEMLQAGWDLEELEGWGLEVPEFESEPLEEDYSGKNQELDIDEMDGDMVIKLKYTEEEYHMVRGQLAKVAATPEQAVWKLLGNE